MTYSKFPGGFQRLCTMGDREDVGSSSWRKAQSLKELMMAPSAAQRGGRMYSPLEVQCSEGTLTLRGSRKDMEGCGHAGTCGDDGCQVVSAAAVSLPHAVACAIKQNKRKI